MKSAKVICCYFGNRRNVHNTPKNIFDFIIKNIENEINIENGFDLDVFLVVNNSKNINDNMLESYNNTNTKNGKIYVLHRENTGGSFGAYFETFYNHYQDYDYWYFCEDDVLIFEPEYIKKCVDFINSDTNIGFVSLAPISQTPIHSGGGCGFTTTEKFLDVYNLEEIKNKLINYPKNFNYSFLESCEIEFTNRFSQKNYKVINHPEFSPLCSNFEKHYGQKKYANESNINLKKIYQVGE